MRCPDCNKFVPYDEPNIDQIELTLDDTTLTLSGELVLPCGECGTELASASLEADEDVAGLFHSEPQPGQEAEYEIVDSDLSPTDRTQSTDRHGKPIKNPRYARRYYGVEATVTIRRTIRDGQGNQVGEPEEAETTIEAEEQAGSFESIA